MNKPQWNLKGLSYIFIKENAFENFVCEKGAILSRPQCVKYVGLSNLYIVLFYVMRSWYGLIPLYWSIAMGILTKSPAMWSSTVLRFSLQQSIEQIDELPVIGVSMALI